MLLFSLYSFLTDIGLFLETLWHVHDMVFNMSSNCFQLCSTFAMCFSKRHVERRKKRRRPTATSKHGLGLPNHIKILLILINIDYQELVLNKPFIKVYYIEFPIIIHFHHVCTYMVKMYYNRKFDIIDLNKWLI